MLASKDATATVAVKDIDNARKFYGGTLGLEPIEVPEEEVAAYQAGATRLLVYRSQFAGTNRATSVTWNVGDEVDAIVRDLRGKGVRFERYEGFPQDEHGVMRGNGPDIAWFTDPAGNVMSVIQG